MDNYKSVSVITPSNTAVNIFDAIMPTDDGNVKVDTAAGESAVVLTGLAGGTVYNIAVTRVYAADLTATGVLGLRID